MDRIDINKIFNKYRTHKSDTDIFHDLMSYKVREILLVATLYDSFILEQEEHLTEKIFGEYYQLSLSNAPRITSISSSKKALELMEKRHFDLIIISMRISDMTPLELATTIKNKSPKKPVVLLLNDNTEIPLLKGKEKKLKLFDRVFVWNGDSKIFLAITKYIEDKMNAKRDTKIGMVRIILLVEDSIRYYSRYMPILYTEVIKQTQRLMREENLDETNKMLKMRARPKIMLATTYEEAQNIIRKYKDYLLSVISDVKFPRKGKEDPEAGIKLIKHVQKIIPEIPTLLQSSNNANKEKALAINSIFIHKNSENLAKELRQFVFDYLGFGAFIFKDKEGKEIDRARNLSEFIMKLKVIPHDSLMYHAQKNQFSAWLMARGEIIIAQRILPVKVEDFKNPEEIRQYLIKICNAVHKKQTKGKVINFDEEQINKEEHILKLSDGSLGGKGRGIAFMNAIIQNTDMDEYFPDINIKIPRTTIIGTEEFEQFIETNRLQNVIEDTNYEEIKLRFINGEISPELNNKLKKLMEVVHTPLAVRSSGLFEDSLSQPFSGIYDTFLIPNNHPNIEVRLNHLKNAIKLVFASVFSPPTKQYFEAVNYKVEEERMAVIIQEIVGNHYDGRYYPHFSGVAQSYNYYPIFNLKPEDGIGVIGVGLGKFVIDGEKAFRFCPKYPKRDFIPPQEQLDNTQRYFYALNTRIEDKLNLIDGEESTLIKLDIDEAEKDGVLDYIASTWDYNNQRMVAGIRIKGPRIINFDYILKYNYISIAPTLYNLLKIVEAGMGTPVEMEFAVNMNKEQNGKPTFYILQIKPVVKHIEEFTIKEEDLNKEDIFLLTHQGMGNGIIENIKDIIFVDPNEFDRMETIEMANEIDIINKQFKQRNEKYILIAPGRWGTKDRFLGIPVIWTQISHAKVIVEVELPDFRIDPSQGSHFFHNMVSMNIGYFSIASYSHKDFIKWESIRNPSQKISKHFYHYKAEKPFIIKMDGRNRIYVIMTEDK